MKPNSKKHHDHSEHECRHCSSHSCKNDTSSQFGSPILLISILFFATAWILEHFLPTPETLYAALYAGAALLSGYSVFLDGMHALIKLRLDETTLMTIAVLAAFLLGSFSEAALVSILFQLGEKLEDSAVDSSRASIQSLVRIRPDTARRITGDTEQTVQAEQITVGDLIQVHPFERIPLDGTVTEGTSFLDASALTGESAPLDAFPGTEVLSGMMNGWGLLKIRVTQPFETSAASRIIDMVEAASARKGKAEKLITRFAAIYTPVVVMMAVLLAVLPPLSGFGDFHVWLYRALIFLVASCPCALVISIPLGFHAGIGALSRHGVLLKGGRYLEILSKAQAVVLDKTGTLTTGNFQIERILPAEGWTESSLLLVAASAERCSAHPVASAITAAADSPLLEIESPEELPGKGIRGIYKGKSILCGRKDFLTEQKVDFSQWENGASVYVAVDEKPAGAIFLSDTLKADSSSSVARLKKLVGRVVMLTGDSEQAASRTAELCGLEEYHSRLTPENKVEWLEKIRRESGRTLFVGDGINDAPVLAAADCGISIGLATDAAIEASDMVLTLNRPSSLVSSVLLSRRIMRVIHFNIVFALAAKAVVLLLAAFGCASIWMAVFADVGVCVLSVLNSARILRFQLNEKTECPVPVLSENSLSD